MQVTNTNNQLRVVSSSNIQFYKYEGISNVTWAQSSGSYFVLITYEDDYFVKLPLANITNQVAWTNSVAGANIAVDTISGWISSSISTFGLATEATLQIIEANTTGTSKTPGYIISSNDFGAIAIDVTSVSFSNNSSVDADISVDGVNYTTLPAGVTLSFDAGAIGNYYPANTFAYDTASYPGSSIIIIYNQL
jgi:hypothetical protein